MATYKYTGKSNKSHTSAPITEPIIIEVEETLTAMAMAATEVERQVIVHARVGIGNGVMGIRIWSSTYLIPHESGYRPKLLNTENITVFPQWMAVGNKAYHYFTLIFEGLPRDCKQFDLIEQIPESGGFEARNIIRNSSDIYEVTF
ncbi:hypothetical protein [Anditalea andensis]|nr:hypothetical protein [Anditalea andensis]